MGERVHESGGLMDGAEGARPGRRATGREVAAIVFAYIGVIGPGVLIGLFVLIAVTSSGPGSLAAVIPLFALAVTSVLWLGCLVAGLLLALGNPPNRHAAIVAMVGFGLGLLYLILIGIFFSGS